MELEEVEGKEFGDKVKVSDNKANYWGRVTGIADGSKVLSIVAVGIGKAAAVADAAAVVDAVDDAAADVAAAVVANVVAAAVFVADAAVADGAVAVEL